MSFSVLLEPGLTAESGVATLRWIALVSSLDPAIGRPEDGGHRLLYARLLYPPRHRPWTYPNEVLQGIKDHARSRVQQLTCVEWKAIGLARV